MLKNPIMNPLQQYLHKDTVQTFFFNNRNCFVLLFYEKESSEKLLISLQYITEVYCQVDRKMFF